ncbi:phosphoribosylanthranilate isomerase [Rhizorhabdus dicambivorans]|uniref:N-(5'-phosphoribosyl)anthranilate isomerase n=1 Tax=Rhizorhabdus dicambivorans TaxID=1850238 RepID=A0A2A4G1U1_9SPHN|nr:phosphoribosylanthranilate isomerase [Rhizorhabdus dicambivorans]ATE67067.1 phosphoribosylanthranilate isomerase [Rhizorhabdus dicambivorans]PCE43690.1 phosphoribosylanthranilate isomerase [Rhizorhabdus dicambivorans]
MQRVTAKICGLSTPETVDAAIAHGASHAGFVFFPKSPRNLAADQARALTLRVPPHVGKVGVFVDAEDEVIDRAIGIGGVDTIQLHGKEPPERLAALRRRHPGIALWKAISIRTRADLDAAKLYRPVADLILYDAKTPEGTLPGGMGLRFDWTLLDGFAHPQRWALSGGIDAGNVADAAGRTGARLIDTSSGVESAPGIKDVDKIAAFLQRVASL